MASSRHCLGPVGNIELAEDASRTIPPLSAPEAADGELTLPVRRANAVHFE